METVLFRKVKVVDPASPWNGKLVDARISEGRIQEVAEAGTLEGEGMMKEGGSISPGWVDMRTYLTDPGYEWKEDLVGMGNAAAAGGFTRVVGHPAGDPLPDKAGHITALLQRSAALPVHLHPTGSVSQSGKGEELAELFDLHRAGAIGFSDGQHPILSTGLLLRALQYLKPFDGLAFSFPVESSLVPDAIVGEGVVSTRMGLRGIPAIAEELILQRDFKVMELFPHRLHAGPVTTAGGVELVRQARKKFPGLTAETSALYLLLDDTAMEQFDPVYKVYPPLRTREDVEALKAGVMDGTLDLISSGHMPQSIEDTRHDFVQAEPGAEGLETAFAVARTAFADLQWPIDQLIRNFCHLPRNILNLTVPVILQGGEAELTWFDEDRVWIPAFEDIRSPARNNPFVGRKLVGKPLGVYVKGCYWGN